MIYTNGCSYTLPNGGPSWSEYLALWSGDSLYPAGQGGNSNEKILRQTVSDLLKLRNVSKVIISLTFENRFDVVDRNKTISITPGFNVNDTSPECQQFIKYKRLMHDSSLALHNIFSQLVALKTFIESRNADFFVFWGADEFDILNQTHIKNLLKSHLDFLASNSFDLLNFSFCRFAYTNGYTSDETRTAGIHAHPPADAHLAFAKLLQERLDYGH